MADEDSVIIIKKINKGEAGHHGGAWKVAYADFVTAMMAFFLLLWLLNATEAEQLAGLADYFAPTVGVRDAMGIGFRGGKGAISDGIGADINTNKGIVFGGVPSGPVVKVTERIETATMEDDAEKMVVSMDVGGSSAGQEALQADTKTQELKEAMEDYVNEITADSGLNEAIDLRQTLEGLEIQIKDTERDSMFEQGTADIKPKIQELLKKMAEIFVHLPNNISITGHTSAGFSSSVENYGPWELSTDRANATRRFLLQSGLQPERIDEVVGKADNEPLDRRNPEAPFNSRLSIVLMRENEMPQHKKGAPEGVFLDTDSKEAKELFEQNKEVKPVQQEVVEQEVNAEEEAQKEQQRMQFIDAIDDVLKGDEEMKDPDFGGGNNYTEDGDLQKILPDNILSGPSDDAEGEVRAEEELGDDLSKDKQHNQFIQSIDAIMQGGREEEGGEGAAPEEAQELLPDALMGQ